LIKTFKPPKQFSKISMFKTKTASLKVFSPTALVCVGGGGGGTVQAISDITYITSAINKGQTILVKIPEKVGK
jgi:hypothetical protein